ncbi:hypothetical protein [Edaphobacter bradus]|uniref:hypothetical protein n=1 Tax=Edaphobacter bradus TaxID=2259016 RepID=UPI0021DF5CE9|nr:hypothetical protein [Edaphobacter bradus]
MQVLCKPSDSSADLYCPICGRGFLLYWERSSRDQQEVTLPEIQQTVRDHHSGDGHPEAAFNIPSWPGLPQFSAAALLGGATF